LGRSATKKYTNSWYLAVAQFVESLRSRRKVRVRFPVVLMYFTLTRSFRPNNGPGTDSISNRNEYQECFLIGKGVQRVGLTPLPPSCADCLEIWEPQPLETLWACTGLYRDFFTFALYTLAIRKIRVQCKS
jgi:hypothetical protein